MKMTLQELARTNKWIQEESHSRRTINFNGVAVGFSEDKKKGIVSRVRILFDGDVASKLNVKKKDKINVLYHPDDLLSFMLCKSSSRNGISVSSYNEHRNVFRIQFKWKRPFILKTRYMENVEYLFIEKSKSIIFRVDN